MGFQSCQQHNGLEKNKITIRIAHVSKCPATNPFARSIAPQTDGTWPRTVQALLSISNGSILFNDQCGKPTNEPQCLGMVGIQTICPFMVSHWGCLWNLWHWMNHSNKFVACIVPSSSTRQLQSHGPNKSFLLKKLVKAALFLVRTWAQFRQNQRWICSRFGNPEELGNWYWMKTIRWVWGSHVDDNICGYEICYTFHGPVVHTPSLSMFQKGSHQDFVSLPHFKQECICWHCLGVWGHSLYWRLCAHRNPLPPTPFLTGLFSSYSRVFPQDIL